jgi:hypothetical protein
MLLLVIRNQPLKLDDDWRIRILKIKIESADVLDGKKEERKKERKKKPRRLEFVT